MPAFTHFRFLNCRLLVVLATVAGLASGCRSSRPSYSFQPVALRTAARAPHAARARPLAAEAAAAAVVVAVTAVPATTPLAPVVQPVGQVPGKLATDASAAVPAPVAPHPQPGQRALPAAANTRHTPIATSTPNRAFAAPRQLWRPRAHAPARQGLGLTVLGLLGMVALVVALVGLAISGGGGGWIVAAAIAAGVVLLAYLDPGRH